MRINYICNYNGNPNRGVTKKILAQVTAMRQNNVDANLILLTNNEEIEDFNDYDYVRIHKFPAPPFRSILQKIITFFILNKSYRQLLNEMEDDVIIYFRNYYPSYGFYKMLKNSNKKILIDVVSNSYGEAELRGSNFYKFKLKYWGSKIANTSTAIIGVTREIINLNFPLLNSNMPSIVIGNGFDVHSVPLKSIPENDEVLNFICTASFNKWHGVDRFLKGMHKYSNLSRIHLHLVGDGPSMESIVKLVRELNLENKVTFHGFKSGEDLNKLFESAHIGVSNLGTFRKNIKYTSPLKSKEYCARGIPFFYTCIDEDFVNFPFVFNVPASESPININEIIEFYNKVKLEKNYNVIMREFAQNNLTWNAKMKELISFINKI